MENPNNSDRINALWCEKVDLISVYSGSSYVKTLAAVIKASLPYRAFTKGISFIRRFRLLTYIASFLSYALALVGTGAILLVYLSVAAVVLILSALALSIFLVLAKKDTKRSNLHLAQELSDKDVYIFFAGSARVIYQNGFFGQNALDLSRLENACVLIVTPALLSKKGLFHTNGHFFFTSRKECENLFIIRKFYYFSFKKRVLPKLSGDLAMIF